MLHLTIHAEQWVGMTSIRASVWDQDESGQRTLVAKSVVSYYDPIGNCDDLTEVLSAVKRWAARTANNGVLQGP